MLFLSIHPRFVEKILTGEKTIELRRQRPRSVAGDWIAVYATTPERQLRGIVQVKEVRVENVRDLWHHVQNHAAVTKDEYDSYFLGTDQAVGIVLGIPISLTTPVSLEQLRKAWPSFQPPQGFRYLDDDQVQFVKSFSPRRKKAAA
ncbi:MAG: ASCH domain-containing protein [Planctomycetia bacterium]